MGMHGILSSRALERDFFALYAHWLAEMLPQFEGNVFPGVRDLMASCRDHPEGPELGLLTGNTRLGAEIKLRHFDLWEDFLIGAYGDEDPSRPVLAGLAARRGQGNTCAPHSSRMKFWSSGTLPVMWHVLKVSGRLPWLWRLAAFPSRLSNKVAPLEWWIP